MNYQEHGSNVKHRINMIMNVIDLLEPFPGLYVTSNQIIDELANLNHL